MTKLIGIVKLVPVREVVVFVTQQGTPVDYLGHLALKMAYMEETHGNVTIFLKGETSHPCSK